jgi:hypothetical protein
MGFVHFSPHLNDSVVNDPGQYEQLGAHCQAGPNAKASSNLIDRFQAA